MKIWGSFRDNSKNKLDRFSVFILDPEYAQDGKQDTPRGFPGTFPLLPPPNAVTQQLFNVERSNVGSTQFVTILFMAVGQFLDHDVGISSHGSCRQM